MLADFADVFIGPDGQLRPTAVESHRIDTGTHPPCQAMRISYVRRGTSHSGQRMSKDAGERGD
jgi:hypothetical protein